jgi:hypothetical protein
MTKMGPGIEEDRVADNSKRAMAESKGVWDGRRELTWHVWSRYQRQGQGRMYFTLVSAPEIRMG